MTFIARITECKNWEWISLCQNYKLKDLSLFSNVRLTLGLKILPMTSIYLSLIFLTFYSQVAQFCHLSCDIYFTHFYFPENFNVYFYFPGDIKCLTFFAGLQTMLWRRGHQPWRKNIGRQVFRVRSQVECERLYATIPLWSFLRLLEIEGAGTIRRITFPIKVIYSQKMFFLSSDKPTKYFTNFCHSL